jgi:hypothetical protein
LICLGFLLAFRVRSNFDDSSQNAADDVSPNNIVLFDSSFPISMIYIIAMTLGELQTPEMGLDTDVNWPNLVNYIIYFSFLCIIPIFIINIFIGISVDEMRKLIEASKVRNTQLKIEYVLSFQDALVVAIDNLGLIGLRRTLTRLGVVVECERPWILAEHSGIVKWMMGKIASMRARLGQEKKLPSIENNEENYMIEGYFREVLVKLKELDENVRDLSMQQDQLAAKLKQIEIKNEMTNSN